MNDESWEVRDWARRRGASTERFSRKSKTPLPSELYTSAIRKGVKWAFIVFVILIAARALDGAIGINILTPIDLTKEPNYFVPTLATTVLKSVFSNDSSFSVDIPIHPMCCRVDVSIPKGYWLRPISITPIGVTLPPARITKTDQVPFKAAKLGGYRTSTPTGQPLYSQMDGLYGYWYWHPMNPHSIYGSAQIILDNFAHAIQEGVAVQAKETQSLYVGVNIYYNALMTLGKGCYRVHFVVSREGGINTISDAKHQRTR